MLDQSLHFRSMVNRPHSQSAGFDELRKTRPAFCRYEIFKEEPPAARAINWLDDSGVGIVQLVCCIESFFHPLEIAFGAINGFLGRLAFTVIGAEEGVAMLMNEVCIPGLTQIGRIIFGIDRFLMVECIVQSIFEDCIISFTQTIHGRCHVVILSLCKPTRTCAGS